MNNNNNNANYNHIGNNNGYPLVVNLNQQAQFGQIERSTDFVLTINTQQLVTADMEGEMGLGMNREEEVTRLFQDMFTSIADINNVRDGPVKWIDFPRGDGVNNITRPIAVTYVFERIPEGKPNAGRFHVHALIQIRHNSNVSLATARLFQLIRNFLGQGNINPYIFLRFARSPFDAIIRYMRKDLMEGSQYNYNWRNGGRGLNNNYVEYDTEEEE